MKYNRGQRDPRTVAKFANIVRRQDADCFSCADLQIDQILEQLKNTADTNSTITFKAAIMVGIYATRESIHLLKSPTLITHHSSLITNHSSLITHT